MKTRSGMSTLEKKVGRSICQSASGRQVVDSLREGVMSWRGAEPNAPHPRSEHRIVWASSRKFKIALSKGSDGSGRRIRCRINYGYGTTCSNITTSLDYNLSMYVRYQLTPAWVCDCPCVVKLAPASGRCLPTRGPSDL